MLYVGHCYRQHGCWPRLSHAKMSEPIKRPFGSRLAWAQRTVYWTKAWMTPQEGTLYRRHTLDTPWTLDASSHQSMHPPDITNSKQQGHHAVVVWDVATITAEMCHPCSINWATSTTADLQTCVSQHQSTENKTTIHPQMKCFFHILFHLLQQS